MRSGCSGATPCINALAAAAVGWVLGVPVGEIAEGLGSVAPLPMRLAVRRIGGLTLLDDAYNSSPQSVEAALDAMDELPGAPRVAVLGDMRELGARLRRTRTAAWGASSRGAGSICSSRSGRSPQELARSAREAGGVRVVHAAEPEDVLAVLRAELRPGAVVLVKGSRAMAMERIVAGLEAEGTPCRPSGPTGDAHGRDAAVGRVGPRRRRSCSRPARPVVEALRRAGVSQTVREDAPSRHAAKAGTPTMGGLLIIGAALVAALAVAAMLGRPPGALAVALGVIAIYAAIGALDDRLGITRGRNLGLRAREKFALQIPVALALGVYVMRTPGLGSGIGIPGTAWRVDLGWGYPLSCARCSWSGWPTR